MKIRLDLHIHTVFSFDGSIDPSGLRDICTQRGLAGVAVTDHDSLQGGLTFASELPDLVIIPGEEVRSREGEIIGLFLREEIPPGLPAPETMRLIHEQGGLVIIPHPFDYVKLNRMSSRRLEELRDDIDAIEAINGKPRYWGANKRARAFADYFDYAVKSDHFLTYVIINPQAERGKDWGDQEEDLVAGRVHGLASRGDPVRVAL